MRDRGPLGLRVRDPTQLRHEAVQRSRARSGSATLQAFDCGPGTPRLHRCTTCSTVGQWTEGWQWYGTLDGPPQRIACPRCAPGS
jgi:hypothetical protein